MRAIVLGLAMALAAVTSQAAKADSTIGPQVRVILHYAARHNSCVPAGPLEACFVDTPPLRLVIKGDKLRGAYPVTFVIILKPPTHADVVVAVDAPKDVERTIGEKECEQRLTAVLNKIVKWIDIHDSI